MWLGILYIYQRPAKRREVRVRLREPPVPVLVLQVIAAAVLFCLQVCKIRCPGGPAQSCLEHRCRVAEWRVGSHPQVGSLAASFGNGRARAHVGDDRIAAQLLPANPGRGHLPHRQTSRNAAFGVRGAISLRNNFAQEALCKGACAWTRGVPERGWGGAPGAAACGCTPSPPQGRTPCQFSQSAVRSGVALGNFR
jgi:hypothetical protein